MDGLQEVVWSVFDIERASKGLIEVGDYRRIDLPDAPPQLAAAWRTPKDCTRIEQCLLSPSGDDRGHLRLVCFHGAEQSVIRSSQHVWDTGGIFDVDIFSKDVALVYRGLQRWGWTALSDPIDYQIGDFDVRQVVAIGPDGLNIALIQPFRPPLFDLPPYKAMSRIFNTTQIVRNFDETVHFYEEILGWRTLMSLVVNGEAEPGRLLGLPMPQAECVERRVGIMSPDGGNDGSIELIQCRGVAGRDFSNAAVAPNVGLLALRFPVDDAVSYARSIETRGGVLYSPPTVMDLAPYGQAAVLSVRTPDGAILEFYERIPGSA